MEINEPILEIDEIQGNILKGFNKDHQHFLFLEILEVSKTKKWLENIAKFITTTRDVIKNPKPSKEIWTNIAFTWKGINMLAPDADQFENGAFKEGMHKTQRLKDLGDKMDQNGNPVGWKVGDETKYPHILLILGSDDIDLLLKRKQELLREINNSDSGFKLIYQEVGANLPEDEDMDGREHFGFKDGISQPGVRGKILNSTGDFLTPRIIDSSDPLAEKFARPGQPLVWPGEFILGENYPLQDGENPKSDKLKKIPSPEWAKNGSFLVFRRLHQDVHGFWSFAKEQAEILSKSSEFSGMTPERFASLMVGRWPSGTPLMRSPLQDNLALAKNKLALNQFSYEQPTTTAKILPTANESQTPDTFPTAPADPHGIITPLFSHIRKMNPRDENEGDDLSLSLSLTRRILRRGIPYGATFPKENRFDKDFVEDTDNKENDRGLLFLCYQSSIEDKFEFLQKLWANLPDRPRGFKTDVNHPPGLDPLIGQKSETKIGQRQKINLKSPSNNTPREIKISKDFVTTTGGGYFFSPSLSALKNILAK